MQGQQDQQTDKLNYRAGFNVFTLLVNGHATCVAVFLRCGMGVEYPGMDGVVAAALILLCAAGTGDQLLIDFFWLWLVALICQRAYTAKLVRQGWIEHSRYTGWPWAAMTCKWVKSEKKAKDMAEPLLCFGFGAALIPLSAVLGEFVMAGCASLLIQRTMQNQVNIVRLRRMRDAEIEQRQLADRFRGLSDDY